jgi:hypothetical protein
VRAFVKLTVRSLLLTMAVLLALQSQGRATDISANTANKTAILGSAYQSEKESVVGDSCVVGNQQVTGAPVATFTFDQALSEQQAASELGLSAGGRARFGVVEASASASFMRNAVSNELSVSAVWLSEYQLPTMKLTGATLSDIGAGVRNNDPRWATTCGDEYVEEITKGAKLFFSIRLDFSSKEEKTKFSAQFNVSGPLFSAEGTLDTASRMFSRSTKVMVSALQIGGDVSKVTAIFPNTDEGRSGFVQCTLGNFTKCAEVITSALKYASDVNDGFPSQIAPNARPGAANLKYRTAKYTAIGIFPRNYPFLTQANEEARTRLQGDFERQLSLMILTDRLLNVGLGAERQEKIRAQRGIIDANIAKILAASKICYDEPLQCYDAVTGMALVAIDDAVLSLPATPTASIRLYTSGMGLWTRADSVKYMTTAQPKIGVPSLDDLGKEDPASIVLYVQGVGLRDAVLHFENKELMTIPISPGSSGFPGKIDDTSAILVIETTRRNPGWRDIDLPASRHALQNEIPAADGIFFVVIRDALGRETQFDLQYQKWNLQTGEDPRQQTWDEYVICRDRWWDQSNGTSASGTGGWSEDYTEISSTTKRKH